MGKGYGFLLYILNLFIASQAIGSAVEEADVLFEATLYSQAIPLYQERLKAPEPQAIDHLRLGQAYYFTKQYAEAITHLRSFIENPTPSGNLHKEALYWLGISARQLKLYDEAIFSLKQYCALKKTEDCPHFDEANLELGLAYFASKSLAEARDIFLAQAPEPSYLSLYILARLNLAKIELEEGRAHAAAAFLKEAAPLIGNQGPLSYELEFLYGEALYQQKDFHQAAEKYEACLADPMSAPWVPDVWYRLGSCYAKFANEASLSEEQRKSYYKKAEQAFESLLQIAPTEQGYLALGEVLVARAKLWQEPRVYARLEEILSNDSIISSRTGQTKALLLRADAAADYAKKSHLYALLTAPSNSDLPLYPLFWYLRGMNNYEQGLALKAISKDPEAGYAFDLAVKAFQKAFLLLSSEDPQKAGDAFIYQVYSKKEINTPESLAEGINIIDGFLKDYPQVHLRMQEPGEAVYLRGSLAAALSGKEDKGAYTEAALDALKRVVDEYPQSKYAGESLFLLGSLYFRDNRHSEAEQAFLQAAEMYPDLPLAPEALYWAAECSAKSCQAQEKIRQLRLKNGKLYPQSPFAAEAYFKAYSFGEYLKGDRAAIKHLQQMKDLFSKSPFVINAYYLTGLDLKKDRKSPEGKWIRRKNLVEAIEAFQGAEHTFESLFKQDAIPAGQLDYFISVYYKAKIERAMANLSIAGESQGAKKQIYLEYAEDLLNSIRTDFENAEHPLSKHLARKDPYPPILEESSYRLAEVFIKGDNDLAAEQLLCKMLEKYRSAKISRGYFFARCWYQRALLAMKRKEYEEALKFLANSEEAAKGKVLNTDQRLDLWIQQSLCYRECNEMDKAMLILSKIINDDAISGRRLQAMYLRAELYQLQGRQELARKQLEATAKKGGEWALKAKEVLSNNLQDWVAPRAKF